MAAVQETVAIRISLIILVMLTIVFSVTTFIFYKEIEHTRTRLDAAQTNLNKADKKALKLHGDLAKMTQLVDRDADTRVDATLSTFKRHQEIYGFTYNDDATKSYPAMLEFALDRFRKVEVENVEYQTKIEELKASYKQNLEVVRKEMADVQDAYDKTDQRISAIAQENKVTFKQFVGSQESAERKVIDSQLQARKQRIEFADAVKKIASNLNKARREANLAGDELKLYKKRDLQYPDGLIVHADSVTQKAWINLGSDDGLRKPMTFIVYSDDAENIENTEPKGAIEVTRIIAPHMAEVRITKDIPNNPLIRGDKILSAIFRPGISERFAVVGKIDFDGDGVSDLDRLQALIRQGNGMLDAYIDEKDRRHGKMSSATSFLVMGEQPTEKSTDQARQAYTELLEEADKYGVEQVQISDILKYLRYQGRERSVVLGPKADPAQFKPSARRRVAADGFRRRPARGASGGAY